MREPRELYWDSTYAIVDTLLEYYPSLDPMQVGVMQLIEMIADLPGFQDDPDQVTAQFLLDILTEWYEETNPL